MKTKHNLRIVDHKNQNEYYMTLHEKENTLKYIMQETLQKKN